jgi:hypothetical protein
MFRLLPFHLFHGQHHYRRYVYNAYNKRNIFVLRRSVSAQCTGSAHSALNCKGRTQPVQMSRYCAINSSAKTDGHDETLTGTHGCKTRLKSNSHRANFQLSILEFQATVGMRTHGTPVTQISINL